jgi:hypothetical protein
MTDESSKYLLEVKVKIGEEKGIQSRLNQHLFIPTRRSQHNTARTKMMSLD